MLTLSLQQIARALNGEVSGNQVLAPGPGHSPLDRSLSVKLDPGAPDGFLVNSFAGDDPITCKDDVRKKLGLKEFKPNGKRRRRASDTDIAAIIAAAVQSVETEPPQGRIVATYDYTDDKGALLYQVCRFEPKSFRQRRPDGKGGWIWSVKDCRRVPYRLADLQKYPDATVFVCEGEKDADRVASLEHGCATTIACGDWTDDCVRALAGRDCIILEDNDEAGRKKATDAANALHGKAKTVRIVRLPDLPDKGDVSDWLNADQRNAEKFVEVCFGVPLWAPNPAAPAAQAVPAAITGLQFARMDEVEAKHVEWLWQGRLARGKLTLMAGEPGIGKSQISIDIAARISKAGRWPDGGQAEGGGVVILSAEDSADDTLRPRLEAAGAALDRTHVLKATLVEGKPVTFSLQAHLDMLGNKLAELGDAALIIIDPITSYMGKIDGHQTVDVRTVLEPLAAFAEKHDVAVLAISHPPKASQSKALHAVTGSLAFVAAARMVFIATKEPQTDRRLLLPVKNNLGPFAAGLGFSLEQRFVGNEILASHVIWDSAPVTTTADEAVAAASNQGATAMREAVEFLREELSTEARPAQDIRKAANSAGIAWRTVERAKAELGVKSSKSGLHEGWVWELPKAAEARHEARHS
jgi:putative DNA primase/helicase